MPEYAIHYWVHKRVLSAFSREEIELAARIAFWQHPPDNCRIPEQELSIIWSQDFLSGNEVIRVAGEVQIGDFN